MNNLEYKVSVMDAALIRDSARLHHLDVICGQTFMELRRENTELRERLDEFAEIMNSLQKEIKDLRDQIDNE